MRKITPEYFLEFAALDFPDIEARLGHTADELVCMETGTLEELVREFPLEVGALLGLRRSSQATKAMSTDLMRDFLAEFWPFDMARYDALSRSDQADLQRRIRGENLWLAMFLFLDEQREIEDRLFAGEDWRAAFIAVAGFDPRPQYSN